ncbi:dTDP-4-dehydrorhamnose reductase [Tardiphaga sp.]|uniref:dTDP-4-dehydrorhamnose reductase n=1 Tax=Tardiphaga sp. TaxID=1926292 RepID=UPI0026183256|nr:dTDP-4-dehydrorhamnose reductase [Tardiphaga sp.]MDB5619746.1 rfbD [Tardiphaga sp.]
MRILVTGRTGQLVHGLVERSPGTDIAIVTAGRPDFDLTDETSVMATVARLQPDAVINAAAYTAVDKAESEPEQAHLVNALGAEFVARACAVHGIPVIQISTDYVFDGGKAEPYREDDATAPINVYGRSKLEGEVRVARACPQHVILRTAWLHSPWGANFVKTMLRLAATRAEIQVVADQRGSPTYVPDLADAVLAIAARAVTRRADMAWGTYHAANAGEATWFDFAREVMRCAAQRNLPTAEILPIAARDYPTAARRPGEARLAGAKLEQALGLSLPDWRQGVAACVARLSVSHND